MNDPIIPAPYTHLDRRDAEGDYIELDYYDRDEIDAYNYEIEQAVKRMLDKLSSLDGAGKA